SCAPPMQGSCYGMPMQVASKPMIDRANRQGGFFKIVSPSYFSTLQLTLVRGRTLTERDIKGAPHVLVINERLVKQFFDKEDPIGQRILIQEIVPGKTELGSEIPWEVVGIVRDEKLFGMTDTRSAGVYVSNEQSPSYFMTLNVRTAVAPLTLQKPITTAIRPVHKNQAGTGCRPVAQIKAQSLAPNRMQAVLMAVFGTVALVLAGIGLYGVLSYSVAQRTHEIGIRAALGASVRSLLGLILARGVLLTTIGLAIGLAGAWGM